MQFIRRFSSPLGSILLAAEETALTGLWFEGAKHFARGLSPTAIEAPSPILELTCRWLEVYFSGQIPDFTPPLRPSGTEFQRAVWALLPQIPYAQTTTYGALAQRLSQHGLPTSARAVGGAVGRNPISLILPCHRVTGAHGAFTGYAAGIETKRRLLALERAATARKEEFSHA